MSNKIEIGDEVYYRDTLIGVVIRINDDDGFVNIVNNNGEISCHKKFLTKKEENTMGVWGLELRNGVNVVLKNKPNQVVFDLFSSYRQGEEAQLIADLVNNGVDIIGLTSVPFNSSDSYLYKIAFSTLIKEPLKGPRYATTYADFIGNKYAKYVGKYIKFKYSGGDNPNTPRTIKVDTVTEDFITGIDIVKTLTNNGKQEFRKYAINKIVGAITEVDI